MAALVLYPEGSDQSIYQLDQPSMLIGSAPDADLCLESDFVSEHHARIEQKPDGFYIISLANASPVLINGVATTFHQLKNGDSIKLGDVSAEFRVDDADATFDRVVPEEVPQQLVHTAGSTAVVAQPRYAMTCPQCAGHLPPGMPSCPHCGIPLSNLPAHQMNYIPPTPLNQAGPGILPIIAFLAGLTVVGAPVALVLGLITFSIIRQRGGTMRDHLLAKWAVGLGLIWIMVGAGAAGKFAWRAHKNEQLSKIEVYEAKVIRALKNLACAQKYAHTIEFFDTDSDGHGEYGDLSVLMELQSPFFDTELADGQAYEYKFAIREASEGQFLAIAEPLSYSSTGGRTFAIDQDGTIRGGDAGGKRFGQIVSVLPVLQGERSAYYEIDDEIAKDVLNYVQSLSSSPEDQEKKQRIMRRLRKDYSLTSVNRELEGVESTVDRFVTEQRGQMLYEEAQEALTEGDQDVALAKLTEISDHHSSYSKIAAVERELIDLRSSIAQQREIEAEKLFVEAEEKERMGMSQREVQQLFQRIEKLYPDTDIAARIATLKPELQRQLRENNAEEIFSDLMELSPEQDYEKILSQAKQLRRNYNDTDLFGKVEPELIKKERKARACSWRVKTEQNMVEGRKRGALAQLESAIRENPDLQYDLRDLCIELYRDVADAMIEEGDSRGALEYYTQLNRLLQISDLDEQVSRDLLAELHKEVGMADYERNEYLEARWHLSSAAWKYSDNAQFNMRLGASSLYAGLYRPAEGALNQALEIEPSMASALLYRSYLNLRIVLLFEQIISDGFQEPGVVEAAGGPVNMLDEEEDKAPAQSFVITDSEGIESTMTSADGEDEDEDRNEKTIRSRTKKTSATSSFFSSKGDAESFSDSSVPAPTDLDVVYRYNYDVTRNILPDLLMFLQDVMSAAGDFREELKGLPTQDKRAVQLGQLMRVSEFRNQLSDLKATHLEDLAAQKKLIKIMEDMKERLNESIADIEAASTQQPQIQSMADHILPQITSKRNYLYKSTDLLISNMRKENEMRMKVFKLADDSLRSLSSSYGDGRDLSSYIKNLLNQAEGVSETDQALLMLRDSIEVTVDLTDILRAAEGNQ